MKLIVTLVLCLVLVACHEPSHAPEENDYYPLTEGSSWSYTIDTACEFAAGDCAEYFYRKFEGDTVIAGKTYKVSRDRINVLYAVRKEGPRYYKWHLYRMAEEPFIDTSMEPGQTITTHQEGDWKYSFVAEEDRKEIVVNGKKYNNVKVLRYETNYSDGTSEFYAYERRFFVAGVGIVMEEHSDAPYMPGGKKYLLIEHK